MLSRSSSQVEDRYRMLSGHCPDAQCQTKLYFPSYDSSIECTGCGQRHERGSLLDVQEVTDPEVMLHNMVRNLLVGSVVPKQTADSVKVLGLSNYHCKLLSPLLTHYGMDKQGRARPLPELNQGCEVFDCSLLGGRAFLLQPEHIGIMGYGRDQTGSAKYLRDTLEYITQLSGNQEVLVPIHADGDGHCLVHGISRALVGRELFWHALRTNLKAHFLANLARYKNHFKDFLTDSSEWTQIVAESDPDYLPTETELFGLQNIHIFGLANVLHRPIILLDSLKGLQSSGDYSGVFLPVFVPREECSGKDGTLNKPLCIAWSSSGRNHFIALVGVKGRPLPRLPRDMLTKAWGAPHELIDTYIQFDEDDMCTVGGDRSLQDKYVQKLAAAMEEVFVEKYRLHPTVVADVHHYIYKRTGVVGVHQNIIIENTRHAVENKQLFRCLLCSAVSQIEKTNVPQDWLLRGGELYELARKLHGRLKEGKVYAFPLHELNCTYDATKDELVPEQSTVRPSQCAWCQGKQLRQIQADGSVIYFNGDRTTTPAPKTKCNCGFKHYWNDVEYDNNPSIFPVPLKWKGQTYTEDVLWFQDESDLSLNSNAYDIASALVQKHFPSQFGSENLVQQVVEGILLNTAGQQEEYHPISLKDMPTASTSDQSAAGVSPRPRGDTPELKRSSKTKPGGHTPKHRPVDKEGPTGRSRSPSSGRRSPTVGSPLGKKGSLLDDSPSKIILTGHSAKTIHKEELTMSEAERNLRKRIQDKAPIMQQHHPATAETGKQPSASPDGGALSLAGKGTKEEIGQTADLAMETVAKAAKEAPMEVPKQKRVRLTSSDGKQTTLVLDPGTTFSELQGKIEAELQIKAANQKIRYGFPPKELTAPAGDQENQSVPLQNGDRVTVEVISRAQPMEVGRSDRGQHTLSTAPGSSTFPEGGNRFLNRDEIMRGMESLQQDTGDNLDLRLYSLNLMATLMNSDMWTYVQQNATLFERGGLFYAIVERDLGLADGKHFMLPSIPNKKFTYNALEDRIELCLEPVGHFPIRPGVDDPESPSTSRPANVIETEEKERSEFITGLRSKLRAGGSGVVTSGGKQVGGYRAFSGHAHTLASGTGERILEEGSRLDAGSGNRGSGGCGKQEEEWEIPRWAQYQREFKKLLEQQVSSGEGGQSSEAVLMPEEPSEEQSGDPGQEPMQSDPSVTGEQTRKESTNLEGLGDERMDSFIVDSGGESGGCAGASGSAEDGASRNQKMEHSKSESKEGNDTAEGDCVMDVIKDVPTEHRAPSSPLPMEVDAAGSNIENAATEERQASTGGDATPLEVPRAQNRGEDEQPTTPNETTEENSPVYVAKRLGPGYTVLVEQTQSEASRSSERDKNDERS